MTERLTAFTRKRTPRRFGWLRCSERYGPCTPCLRDEVATARQRSPGDSAVTGTLSGSLSGSMSGSATDGLIQPPGLTLPTARAPQQNNMGFDDSVYQRLLRERIIFLGSVVEDNIANAITAQMLLLAAEDPSKDIYLYINSPGGSVSAGMALYDTMQYVPCDVATVAMGLAASMGQFLLCAGEEGKRYALPHARIMMHQPSGGIGGTASDIKIQAEQMLYTKKKMAELIADAHWSEHRPDRVRLRSRPLVYGRRGQGVRLRRPRRALGARRRR